MSVRGKRLKYDGQHFYVPADGPLGEPAVKYFLQGAGIVVVVLGLLAVKFTLAG